jgi:hypothetical protein
VARSAHLDALLGEALHRGLDPGRFQRLVDDHVVETELLEFKQQLHPSTEDGRRELAKDVCAFANAAGGAIVLGVAEDKKGAATRVMPFEVGDLEERQVRSVLIAWAHPFPEVEVMAIGHEGKGLLVIVVAQSPWAPHAVGGPNDHYLSFPVRTGRQTRYLSEHELADRYRGRFEAAGAQVAHLDRVRADGATQLHPHPPWLYLAVVPNTTVPGHLGTRAVSETTEWLQAAQVPSISRSPASLDQSTGPLLFSEANEVGVMKTISATRPDLGSSISSDRHAEFHVDGAGFAAEALWEADKDTQGNVSTWWLDQTILFERSALFLSLLARHALRQGVLGEAAMELGITKPGPLPIPAAIGLRRNGRDASQRLLLETPTTRHTVDLTLVAADATALLLTTRAVTARLVQAFGVVELAHVDDEGVVEPDQFGFDVTVRSVLRWRDSLGAESG